MVTTLYRQLTGRMLASICGLSILAACGGGDEVISAAGSSIAITGTAATGAPLVGAQVTAKCQFNTTGSGVTQADGLYTLDVLASVLPCAIRVVPAGGGQALYSMANGTKSPLTINVTPLTSLAVSLAVKDSIGQTTEAWFDAANSLGTVSNALAGAQTKLGAALKAAGYTLPSPFEPVTEKFSPKLGDKYDDLLEAVASGIKASGGTFASAQAAFVAGGGAALPKPSATTNSTGTSSTTSTGNVTGTEPSVTYGTVAATVHALVVKSYNLAFYTGGGAGCDTVCSFTDKQALAVVVGAGGTLNIGGKQLTNPYNRTTNGKPHLPEIIWRDGDVEYALSDNASGMFNEINVGNLAKLNHNSLPSFVGQIRAVEQTGFVNISQYAGTYTKSAQYIGPTTTWTGVTIGTDGAISFTGGVGPSLSVGEVSATSDFNGCCGNVMVTANKDINNDSKIDNFDIIRLYRGASGNLESIEHSFTSNGSQVGAFLFTPTPLPAQGSGPIPAANFISFTAGTTSQALPLLNSGGLSAINQSGFNLSGIAAVDSNNNFLLFVGSSTTLATGTTYSCYKNGNAKNNLTINSRIGNAMYNSLEGGRCELIFTEIAVNASNQITLAKGRVVADLRTFKRDGTALVLSDVAFHYVK